MVVLHIEDDNKFAEALLNAGPLSLVVCDFYADWCGPCRFIAPQFENLSNKFSDAVFLKVNVDSCQMTCQIYQIRAMPTFVLLFNRRELGRLSGANSNALERLIVSNLPAVSSTKLTPNKNVATEEEKAWLQNFLPCIEQVKQYEDEINQTLALSLLSLEDLHAQSMVNDQVNEYEMAKNLMSWFHDSFFTWVDNPNCEKCNLEGEFVSCSSVLSHEENDGASRVEIYYCKNCCAEFRFPRYKNVAKLLETRKGRCGEWADCFALFCRAVGFKTRWVSDDFDHVWVEVWSKELDRWLHLDPCENVIDTPLMYDKSWGKKYSYVIAYAIDHVRDVTWRYCFDHKAAAARRQKCRESVFRNFLTKLNNRLSKNLPMETQNHLTTIFMKELVEFMSPTFQLRDGSEAENRGRKSGSRAWRVERGEQLLENNDAVPTKSVSCKIKPTEKEIDSKSFVLTYNCVRNEYCRPNNSATPIKEWQSLTKEANNVFRKVEKDWKITYLCRKETAETGHVVWRVDLDETKAKNAEITLGELTTYTNGKITAIVCCGDFCSIISNEIGYLFLENIENANYLEIRVEFSGGSGDNAWQSAQLFRTKNSEPSNNFKIQVNFE